MKAQAAIEYISISLIGALLFTVLFFISADFMGGRSFEGSLSQARLTVTSLTDAANEICLQPQGSKTEVLLPVPLHIDPMNSSVANRTVAFALRYKDRLEFVSATSRCELNGSLPSVGGTYAFEVEREATAVNITAK
ncbi:MAG: hypothetical protein HYS81_02785 [Candidatus Aenigmatarchaeota archaeon]|nr:MAG: hypothetical protein HYS81_02785 [Candidatus Aenigmarchaeota archaeon]